LTAAPTPTEIQSALLSGLEEHAGTAIVIGIIFTICGILSVAAPLAAGIAVTISVGILLLICGVGQCLLAFRAGAFGRGLWIFLIGALTAIVGAYLVNQPLAGLADITIVLMCFFVVTGIFELFASLQVRPAAGWGWMAFNGVVTLVLGILIWNDFPLSGAWAVGVLFGVRMLLTGWTLIVIGSALRRKGREGRERAPAAG
jgi:uncharacterized membrane protein HdeD (DUF308 family)